MSEQRVDKIIPADRGDEVIVVYAELEGRLHQLYENMKATDDSIDPAILNISLEKIIVPAAKELKGSEASAIPDYVDKFFGRSAKYFARDKLREVSTEKLSTRPHGKILVSGIDELMNTLPEHCDQVLEDSFDRGDVVSIIAPSKHRKSFFALQLALCISVGKDFLGIKCIEPKKVFLVQNEIAHKHFHRRIRNMANALGLSWEDHADYFSYANTRGVSPTMSEVAKMAVERECQVLVLDPLYTMMEGDENKLADVRPIIDEMKELVNKHNLCVIYVHHDAKGVAGQRQLVDRGSGSGGLARNYDAGIFLTAHRDEDDAYVMETVFRNYRDWEPTTIGWREGCFMETDLPPVIQTANIRDSEVNKKSLEYHEPAALKILLWGPMPGAEYKDKIKNNLGVTRKVARDLYKHLMELGLIEITSGQYNKKEISITLEGKDRVEGKTSEEEGVEPDDGELF